MPMPGMNYGWNGNSTDLTRRAGAGSYQLADGSWHQADKLVFDGEQLVVKEGPSGRQRLTAETLRRLEVNRDTFLLVESLPGRAVPTGKAEFVHSCVNRQGLRLLAKYYNQSEVAYFLSRSGQPLRLLPRNKNTFRETMAALVADYPALAARVLDGRLGPNETVRIIQDYADFRRSAAAVAPAAVSPPPPGAAAPPAP